MKFKPKIEKFSPAKENVRAGSLYVEACGNSTESVC